MTVFDPQVDAAATNAAVEAVLSTTPTDAPSAPVLPDSEVALPGGYFDLATMSVSRTAQVRELNGDDEEAILRHQGNLGKTLETILQRGVESVGGQKATPQVLDGLLAADRDTLLVNIRSVTFGDTITLVGAACPHCRHEQELTISCRDDIPVKSLEDPSDREFETTLASGKRVKISLPNGATQRAIANSEDTNLGVLNTILLTGCVKEINGFPVVNADHLRKVLSMRDRDEIRREIDQRNPGPRLGEVSRPCAACGEPIALPLTMVDLFRL